jgi:hypothetical protein
VKGKYITVKISALDSSVKKDINILQVTSKTAFKHQKRLLNWAGKLQIRLLLTDLRQISAQKRSGSAQKRLVIKVL